MKFLEISFEQVMISKVQLDSPPANGNSKIGTRTGAANTGDIESHDLPTESVSMNYGKIEWTYTQQKRTDGSGGGNVSAKYDLTAGK